MAAVMTMYHITVTLYDKNMIPQYINSSSKLRLPKDTFRTSHWEIIWFFCTIFFKMFHSKFLNRCHSSDGKSDIDHINQLISLPLSCCMGDDIFQVLIDSFENAIKWHLAKRHFLIRGTWEFEKDDGKCYANNVPLKLW